MYNGIVRFFTLLSVMMHMSFVSGSQQPRRNMIMGSVQGVKSANSAPAMMMPDIINNKASVDQQSSLSMQSKASNAAKAAKQDVKVYEPKDFKVSDQLSKIDGVVDHHDQVVLKSHDMSKVEDENSASDKSKKDDQHDPKAKSDERIHEPHVLYQDIGFVDDDPATIAFNFEDASLSNLLSYMESTHGIKFLTDDMIVGAKDAKGNPATAVSIAGHKINFRTNRNLTRKESWDLFLTFLHIAGLDVIPMHNNKFYRIVSLTKAFSETVPTYIGVDKDVLPDSDMIVRYVYFTKNVDPAKLQALLKNMQGGSGKLDVYADLKGLIFTDRACAIKSLMQIVMELDKAASPEVVSVVKLQRANVDDVIKLYNSLKPANPAGAVQPQKAWVPVKKEATLDYFPSDITLVGDQRTNSLIILGTARDVARVEEFVSKYIDVHIDRKTPPVFTYRLQYTNATDIFNVISKVVTYGGTTPAGQYGGVRDGIKFFQKMNIVPDSFTNSLLINSTQEDYDALVPLIKELDVPQKQIGLEVLIVQVKDSDVKTLGAQLSGPNGANSPVIGASPYGPTFGQSFSAQTSGVPSGTPIVVSAGQTGQDDFSIKSSLARLLGNPSLNEVGSVLLTFGQPIWAIFKILKTITSTHIVQNPFLVVSNNSSAMISSGEERRQVSGEVTSAQGAVTKGFTPVQATLSINITPQINKNNIINLNINVQNSIFTQADAGTDPSASNSSPRDQKTLQTIASVANGETLVLGGIMAESYTTSSTGVPFLEHVPLLGWFFKSKTRKINRDHFLIFICPRVMDPVNDDTQVDSYSKYKLHEVQNHLDLIDQGDWFASAKDPLQKAFFGSEKSPELQQLYTGSMLNYRKQQDGKINHTKDQAKKMKRKSKKSLSKKKPESLDLNAPDMGKNIITSSVHTS